MDKSFTPQALEKALDKLSRSGINVKALCRDLSDGSLTYYNKLQSKTRGKKSVLQDFIQPLIDKKPQFLTFLEEFEQEINADIAAAAAPGETVSMLKELKSGQAQIVRLLETLIDQSNYAKRYIDLLESLTIKADRVIQTPDVEPKTS